MAAPLQNIFKRAQARDGSPRFTLTLSAPALTLVGAVVIVILGWSFFMGFMVGRGQNPEERMDEIAQMFQAEEKARTPEAPAPAGEQAAGPADGVPLQAAPAGALPAPGQAQSAPASQAGQAPQAAQPAQPRQAEQPAQQAKAQPKPSGPVYFFNYRLAAVKSPEAAQQEQKRYKAKGFSSRIVKFGKGQALEYTLSGTEKDDAEFRARLKAAGLGAPQLLSKKKK